MLCVLITAKEKRVGDSPLRTKSSICSLMTITCHQSFYHPTVVGAAIAGYCC
jgi:hypothetical protein